MTASLLTFEALLLNLLPHRRISDALPSMEMDQLRAPPGQDFERGGDYFQTDESIQSVS